MAVGDDGLAAHAAIAAPATKIDIRNTVLNMIEVLRTVVAGEVDKRERVGDG
jgi:hypothetical protein